MLIYNYNPITFEYTSFEEAGKNPLDPETPIIPSCATQTKPPEVQQGYAIVWVGNKWEYKEDHRGETWYNADTKTLEIINFIGVLPTYYYSPDSPIANKPDGDYWVFDSDLNEWVADIALYKQYISQLAQNVWSIKLDTPFEFEGYRYLPSWRELYTSIWVALDSGIKTEYTLQDYDSNYNTVDKKAMNQIMVKLSNIIDEMYTDKHSLEKYFATVNDYNQLNKKYQEWSEKEYK
jgi:hypothetical protein